MVSSILTIICHCWPGQFCRIPSIIYIYVNKAFRLVDYQILPPPIGIEWGRIYSNWRPVLIDYEKLADNDNDVGFRILENEDTQNPDLEAFLKDMPYLFQLSEIDDVIGQARPDKLFLRNKIRMEDYFLHFYSEENMNEFLKLFPNAKYDESKSRDYYFIR